jgi:hypothetical protein
MVGMKQRYRNTINQLMDGKVEASKLPKRWQHDTAIQFGIVLAVGAILIGLLILAVVFAQSGLHSTN